MVTNPDTSSIFISYCSADREFAHQLADDLQAADLVTVLEDETNSSDQCELLVLVISRTALVENAWQRPYRTFAVAGKMICPVRVDDVLLPTALDQLNWVDFQLGHQTGLNGLIAALTSDSHTPIDVTSLPPLPEPAQPNRLTLAIVLSLVIFAVGIALAVLLLNSL